MASFLVAVCGVPGVFASWGSFTYMGVEINRLGKSSSRKDDADNRKDRRHHSVGMLENGLLSPIDGPGDEGGEEAGTSGIYLGILNLFTTVAQLIGSIISMVVFAVVEPGGGAENMRNLRGLDVDVGYDGVGGGSSKGGVSHDGLSPLQSEAARYDRERPNAIAICLFIGGCTAVLAAYCTARLRRIL